nr:uncharacterized protein LOC104002156 [Pan troglodytes]
MTSLQDGVETWAECAGLACKGWGHVASMVLFVQVASGRAVSRDEFPSPCLAHHCPALWALRLTERDPPHPGTLWIEATQRQSLDDQGGPTRSERQWGFHQGRPQRPSSEKKNVLARRSTLAALWRVNQTLLERQSGVEAIAVVHARGGE